MLRISNMEVAEILAAEFINATLLDDNDTSTEESNTRYNQTSYVYRVHKFHYIHVLLPFLVGMFLVLYILGLICHYRNVVLIKDHLEKRANTLSSSGTSLNSEFDKPERTKGKMKRTMSETTASNFKRFMSNFTNIDTIQT